MMDWSTPESIEYLLKDKNVFWENYCSSQTKNVLEANNITKDSELFSSFYLITKRLAELMPNLDHNSPAYAGAGWTPKKRPLIILGKGKFDINNKFSMRQENTVGGIFIWENIWENKILLCGSPSFVEQNKELDWDKTKHIWSENKEEQKLVWRGVKEGRKIFNMPVDLKQGEIPNDHPLHDNHPLTEALKNSNEIGTQYEANNTGLPNYPVYPKHANCVDK